MSDAVLNQGPVLVVDCREDELAKLLAMLRAAGYQASGANCFEDARSMLATLEPLVLLTSVKLGRHNGIHLVVRARMSRPQLSAIVTHHVFDAVLEAEANRQEAKFVVQPCSTAVLMEHVSAAADAATRARRLAR
jgi:DNA-binding NtrC family response regulator